MAKKTHKPGKSHVTSPHRIKPGSKVQLSRIATDSTGGLSKKQANKRFKSLIERMQQLQELMYADDRFSLLIVLQAMDAGGKDSTIRSVFGPINPQGCHVTSFKAPNDLERQHDYLWRIHKVLPNRGEIGIFNRSHYEDIVAVRVRKLAPPSVWKKRYNHLNAFEKMLTDEGTKVLKFFLHISPEYQKKRMQRRLDRPDKWWKFDPNDLKTRALWDEHMRAFGDVFSRCSTTCAPWYVIPAENRWYRDVAIAQILVDQLESMGLKYPEPTFDPKSFKLK